MRTYVRPFMKYFLRVFPTGMLVLMQLIFQSPEIHAQARKAIVKPITDMRFETIDERNGLHNLVLGDFRQDRLGFIWIASQDGLHRYDGKNFRIFMEENGSPASVLSSWITALESDHQGRIWMTYFGGGFSIYDPGTELFAHFPPGKGGLSDKSMFYLFCDSDGEMWVHTGPDEIGRLYTQPPYFRKIIPDQKITHTDKIFASFQEDRFQKGLIWLTGTGVYSYNKRTGVWKNYELKDPSIPINNINSYTNMRQLADGRLVMCAWGTGITVFNPSTGKWKRYLHEGICDVLGTHNIIYWLEKRDEHSVWVNTSLGFGYFELEEEAFHILDKPIATRYNLPNANMGKIFCDRDQNVWIGHNQGVNILKNNYKDFSFQPVPVSHTDNGDFYFVSKVLEDTIEQVRFVGTSFADGLHIEYLNTGKTVALHVDYMDSTEHTEIVQDVVKDDFGQYWVLSRDYIYQLNLQQLKLKKIEWPASFRFSDQTPYLLKFYYTGGDSIWVGSYSAGLLCMNLHTLAMLQYRHDEKNPNSLSSDYAGDMQLDPSGRMWVRTRQKTIDVLNFNTGKVMKITPENLPSKNQNLRFTDVSMDASGKMWISSNSGLFYSTGNLNDMIKWKLLGPIEGVPTGFFYGINFDSKNNIWSLTPSGLFKIDPAGLKAERFTSADGLGNVYFSSRLFLSADDKVFIGYWKGYYQFKRTRSSSKRTLIPRLASFHVWNKSISAFGPDVVMLQAEENSISIDFTAVDFINPEKILFSTKLEGLDSNWSAASPHRFVSFPRLPGGEYRFLVRVIDETGEWREPRELVKFTIATPVWKQTWFIVTTALVCALFIFGLYRYRIRRVLKEEALKTQFNKRLAEAEMRALRAQMNPHFIFNCLNSINRYIVKSDQMTASLYLTRFSKLIRLILDNSNHKAVSLEQDLEALRIYVEMEALRFDNKFDFTIEVDKNTDTFSIQVPPMIFQPFIENAIWHGLLHKEGKGKLAVRISKEKRLLSVIIEDNGIGRRKAAELKSKSATTRKSMGMQLTEERMQLLKSELKADGLIMVEDLEDTEKKPVGTRVTILLPIEE